MADEVNKNTNIIILDAYEEFVTWLDPEKVEIVETNKESTQRTISISYPLESNLDGKTTPWFAQGNKIYIPSTLGIDSCLYVINTTYSIDYWEKNQVTVSAEEVLTEFNYMMFEYVDSTPLTINDTNLDKWFGEFYNIGKSDSIDSNKNTITPAGTMTKMSLLRLIEETTGYIFVREYTTDENNIINRKLTLKRSDNVGTLQTEYLDLNRNVESMELEVDESSTYNAMAPVLSLQNSTVSTTTDTVTSSASSSLSTTQVTASSDTSTSRAELKKILTTWKNLSVGYRQKIPMIVETQTDGSVKYTAEWYAPYTKKEGDLYISDPTYSNMNYNQIIPQSTKGVKINPLGKIGTATTSEKDPYAIYNVLANKLSEHRTPTFTLKISVKDIQLILGEDNLGYSLYDSLYVRIPGFDYYVKCLVTETKKNLHLPGENTITLSSTVTGTHIQEATSIIANDQIVNQNNATVNLGGYLNDVNSTGVPKELITMSIELIEAYKTLPNNNTGNNNTSSTTLQAVLDFHPEKTAYIFTNAEILNMSYIIRNYHINNGSSPASVNMQTVDGKIYHVPYNWCRAIWYTRNDYFILKDMDLSSGQFSATISVSYIYTNLSEMHTFLKKNGNYNHVKYWANWYYLFIKENKEYIKNLNPIHQFTDCVGSNDLQTGGDCVPATFATASLMLFDYITEESFAKTLKTINWSPGVGGNGTNVNNFSNVSSYNFNGFWVEATWNNLRKYTTNNSRVILSVYTELLPYRKKKSKIDYSSQHCIHVGNYFETSDEKYMFINDTNFSFIMPYNCCNYNLDAWRTTLCTWKDIYNALEVCKAPSSKTNKIYDYHGTTAHDKYKVFFVLQLTGKNRVTSTRQYNSLTDGTFNPDAMEYKFSSTELRRVYRLLKQDQNKDSRLKETKSYTYDVKDTQGNTWKIDGDWIIAMINAYLYTYKGKTYTTTQTEKIITVNQNSASKYFHDVRSTAYDWHNFFYTSDNKEYAGDASISQICYYLGTIILPYEVKTKYPITSNINDTVKGYTDIIKSIIKEDQNKTLNSKQFTVNSISDLQKYKEKGPIICFCDLNASVSSTIYSPVYDEFHKRYGGTVDTTLGVIYDVTSENINVNFNFLKGNDPEYKPYITGAAASDITPDRAYSYSIFKKIYTHQQDDDLITVLSFQELN